MTLDRRQLLLAGAAALLPAATPARGAETRRVNIPADRTAFAPAEITVKVGDTVRWRNRSIVAHTVVCDPAKAKDPKNAAYPKGAQPFASAPFADDATYEHTFTVPGTYLYVCLEHEPMGMVGKVVVEA